MAVSVLLFAAALAIFLLGSEIRLSCFLKSGEKPAFTVSFLFLHIRLRQKEKQAVGKKPTSNKKKKLPLRAFLSAGKFLLSKSLLVIRGPAAFRGKEEDLFSLFPPTVAAGLSVLRAFTAGTLTVLLSSLCGRLIIHTDKSAADLDVSLSLSLFTGIRAFLLLIFILGKEKINDRKATHRMDADVV